MRKVGKLGVLLLAVGALSGSASGGNELPRLPTQLGSPGLAVRPPVVLFTGDSSGWLGGFDGKPRSSQKLGWTHFGHFTWTSWTSHAATGVGAAWLRTCWDAGCDETHWFTAYRATAHALRPVRGHFTRLAIVVSVHGRLTIDCRNVGYVGPPESYYAYGPSFHCRP